MVAYDNSVLLDTRTWRGSAPEINVTKSARFNELESNIVLVIEHYPLAYVVTRLCRSMGNLVL